MGRIIDTQPATVRGVFPVSATRSIVVRNDPELIEDRDYASGVMEDLQEAWDNNDYFLVELIDKQGHVIESVGSMAGYGSPKKAAAAALKDFWKLRSTWAATEAINVSASRSRSSSRKR